MVTIFISDLFFNHRHEHYESLFSGKDLPSMDQEYNAILADAWEFSELVPVEPEELAQDFLNRR